MAKVSIYLNFMGNAEEAFNYYKSVFKSEFVAPISRMKDVLLPPEAPKFPENEANKVLNVALPILGGTVLMGSDMLESLGHKLRTGNNITINLEPDSREETVRLFDALTEGATEVMPLQNMFWGAYWGTCLDRFGVRWMFNYTER